MKDKCDNCGEELLWGAKYYNCPVCDTQQCAECKTTCKTCYARANAQQQAELLTHDLKRARHCVKLASARTEDPFTKDWLDKDERGTWELQALDLLKRAPGLMAEKGLQMSDAEVDDQVAGTVAYLALTASLKHARKSRGV